MNRPQGRIAIQGTNDSSIVSKYSVVQMGYYSDLFIKYFVTKPARRTPLINRGYYIRAKAIDRVISNFLKSCSERNKPVQILSLGSGFDTLYFRVKNTQLNVSVVIIETDFPDILDRKKKLIHASNLCGIPEQTMPYIDKSCNNGIIVLDLEDYKMLGLDLNNISALERLLRECCIDTSICTLILSECAITYMEESKSSDLIKWASTFFQNALFATYEQISPDDGFGLVMLQHFQQIGSPLCSVSKYSDVVSQQQRYLALGWQHCDAIDMNSFYNEYILSEEKYRIDHLELFDEYEEFHLKCSHYVLVCAWNGEPLHYPIISDAENVRHLRCQDPVSITIPWVPVVDFGNALRFGHQSQILGSDVVVTVGGFGYSKEGGHRRLSNILVTDIGHKKDFLFLVDTESLKNGRLHHSLTAIADNTLLIIGGRTSPARCCSDVITISLENQFASLPGPPSIKTETVAMPKSCEQSRWRHTATAVIINGNVRVVVFGGKNQDCQVLGDCYFLDVDTWCWTKIDLTENGPSARHSHAACSWNQSVIISGGLDATSIPLKSIHILDCVTCAWMTLNVPVVPRYSHTAHSWTNKLFLIGGVNTQNRTPPGIDIIDLLTQCYCQLSLPKMPRPYMFHKHSSVLIRQQEIILILGGGGNCFSFGTHLNCNAVMVNLNELCILFEQHKIKY